MQKRRDQLIKNKAIMSDRSSINKSTVNCQSGIQVHGEALVLDFASCHGKRKRGCGKAYCILKSFFPETLRIIAKTSHMATLNLQ